MGRRSLPLVRAIVSGMVLVAIGSLACCDSSRILFEQAEADAEEGVALSLEITLRQTADLLAERAAQGEISGGDILAIFGADVRDYEATPPSVPETRALIDLLENADGSVTFSVFFQAKTYRAAGLSSVNLTRYSCGTLIGRFGYSTLSVADLVCPPEFEDVAGENSLPLSMTENAVKHGVNVNAAP